MLACLDTQSYTHRNTRGRTRANGMRMLCAISRSGGNGGRAGVPDPDDPERDGDRRRGGLQAAALAVPLDPDTDPRQDPEHRPGHGGAQAQPPGQSVLAGEYIHTCAYLYLCMSAYYSYSACDIDCGECMCVCMEMSRAPRGMIGLADDRGAAQR